MYSHNLKRHVNYYFIYANINMTNFHVNELKTPWKKERKRVFGRRGGNQNEINENKNIIFSKDFSESK